MLNTPAPFPDPGCHALILVDPGDPARAHGDRATAFQSTAYVAVRLLRYVAGTRGDCTRDAKVSLLAVEGASGQRTIPATLLRDATPLDANEKAELAALEARITGRGRVSRKIVARHDALTERAELAPILARQLRRASRAQSRGAERHHEEAFA